jgi:membrane protein DedA with SNARE-associated domain
VDPPSLTGVLDGAVQTLGVGAYAIVAVIVFSEMVGLGLVSPGETTLFIAGAAAADGSVDLAVLLAVAWAAAVAGDLTGYGLGRRRGRRMLERRYAGTAEGAERLRKLDAALDRWGALALVGGRFFGPVRAFAPFLAGASQMEPRRLVPASLTGAGVWTAAMILAGFGLAGPLAGYIDAAGSVFLAGAAAVLVIWAARRMRRRRAQLQRG